MPLRTKQRRIARMQAAAAAAANPAPTRSFDPDAAATGDGLFGLDCALNDAKVVVIPVPFEATTSYRPGTAGGPAAVLKASKQVDLEDLQYGPVWKSGIAMVPVPEGFERMARSARRAAEPIIQQGGVDPASKELARALAQINSASERVHQYVATEARRILDRGALPAVLGGDHSCPFGLIQELAARHRGLGVLQIDAHADLRERFEGFDWSHASIFHNVMTKIRGVDRLVQVGIRDFGLGEKQFVERSKGRVRCFYDQEMRDRQFMGGPRGTWHAICKDIVAELPKHVYISFDIDGLSPELCPNTGTPVPGGLSFAEVCHLLLQVAQSGRTVVGFDLCEVANGRSTSDWNANVGARTLYKLIGCMVASQPQKTIKQ
jgi:agmatinase